MKYPKIDCAGRALRAGDVVRIIGIPDLSDMAVRPRNETRRVFEYLKGKYKRIKGFNLYGHAEIEFRIFKATPRNIHTVWIEPWLVRKKLNQGKRR